MSIITTLMITNETASCVLICMTEKYKESNNCRMEAEYTIQKQKPLIPLIMQKSYRPDGWLGFILGSKIYINNSIVLRNVQQD